MGKLFTCAGIVFLTIFTVGLATADRHTHQPPQPITTTTGDLWFVDTTGHVTQVTGATITLNPVTPTIAGEPDNIWFGTLSLPSTSPAGAATVSIAAFSGSDDWHLFHNIHGSDVTTGVTLSATGNIDDHALDSTSDERKRGFGIRGTVSNSNTKFIGDFEGVLF
jgi:hypothetical protein